MVRRAISPLLAAVAMLVGAAGPVTAQGAPPTLPSLPVVEDGSVWKVDYIRSRNRKQRACLQFYGANWRVNRAEAKRTGLVLSYMIWTAEPVGPDDWDIMLATEYRNYAALDGLEEKFRPILAARTRVVVPDLDLATDCVIIGSRTTRQVEFGK
jgi:hypothetical protein